MQCTSYLSSPWRIVGSCICLVVQYALLPFLVTVRLFFHSLSCSTQWALYTCVVENIDPAWHYRTTLWCFNKNFSKQYYYLLTLWCNCKFHATPSFFTNTSNKLCNASLGFATFGTINQSTCNRPKSAEVGTEGQRAQLESARNRCFDHNKAWAVSPWAGHRRWLGFNDPGHQQMDPCLTLCEYCRLFSNSTWRSCLQN